MGRQEMQQKEQRKDTMSPLNTDGSQILHAKNRHCRTDGLLSTASTSTTSTPSTWTTLLLGLKEIDTRTCSYCGTKTEKTMARCQSEMTSNLQPDHLLWPATRKVKDIHTLLGVDDFDSDHRMHNLKQIGIGWVSIIKKFLVRNRHLLHLRQPGGNLNSGKNDKLFQAM